MIQWTLCGFVQDIEDPDFEARGSRPPAKCAGRTVRPQMWWLSVAVQLVSDTRYFGSDFVDAGAGYDIKGLRIFVAPSDIRDDLGHFDCAEMFSFG